MPVTTQTQARDRDRAYRTTNVGANGNGVGDDDATTTTTTTTTSSATKKKKYVRVITDKRREQNRRAQKLYKERLKRKLEDLEGLAQSVGAGVQTTTTTTPATNTRHSPPTSGRVGSTQGHDHASNTSTHTNSHGRSSSPPRTTNARDTNHHQPSASLRDPIPHMINLADAFTAAGDLPFASGPVPGLSFSGQDISTPAPIPTPVPTPIPILTHDALLGSTLHKQPESQSLFDPNLDPSLLRNDIHEDLDDVDLCHIWPNPPRSPGQVYTPPPSSNKRRGIHHHHSTAMILTPQSSQYSPRSGRGFPAFGASYGTSSGFSSNNNHIHFMPVSASHLPDPYSNHMRLWMEDNIEATIAIARAVGISRSEYINDHPSRFPGCYLKLNEPGNTSLIRNIEYTGFDYPCTKGVLHSETGWSLTTGVFVTKELKEHMDRVQPALRPTPAQLLQPHPSYLDCIVFPFVRERAICASARGLLDHPELFLDLMNGGMVCWGGGSGMTTRPGRRDMGGDGNSTAGATRRGMGSDVAWDTRSWEAKKWFLKKWEWLVGSEEEEELRGDVFGIWRGSRWWWRMRGEEDDQEEEEEYQEDQEDLGFVGHVGDSGHVHVDVDVDGFPSVDDAVKNGLDGQGSEGVVQPMYPDLHMPNGEMGRVTEIEGHCL